MNALKRIVDAQARLQGQFDAHRCDAEATSRGTVRGTEEEDDRKKPGDKDDDKTDDGDSEQL
jgi:hypothetical protein